jgi:hypothetical protein
MAMMAITTSSSIKVNPDAGRYFFEDAFNYFFKRQVASPNGGWP